MRKKKKKARAQKTPRRRDAGRPRGPPLMDAVLACTLDELARAGVDGLSVDRVARAADVNKTSIYRRWPTREALAAAAFERVLVDVEVRLPDTGSLRGDLRAALALIAGAMTSSPGRALARTAFAASLAPELASLVARQTRRTRGPVHDVVARARARNEWRADAPTDVVLTMMTGAVFHRVLVERRSPSATWLDALASLVVRAVA